MSREESLREERIKKLENLAQKGHNPFAIDTCQDRLYVADVLAMFPEEKAPGWQKDKEVCVAGRIRSVRTHGKIAFADLEDASGRLQILLRENNLKESDSLKLFMDNIDEGDFVEVKGLPAITKAGQESIDAADWKILTKAIRAIPSEHYGLKDIEQRLRKRYLDLIANPEVRQMFVKKSRFWQSMREFLIASNFLEVQTPVLESIPGGAEAEPFITHHNALDEDFYLRISLELPLKRLLVGGFEKVFEIGRIFRNEGIDAEHLQDYTQMEMYWAYADYEQLMEFVQKMYQHVIEQTTGGLKTTYRGQEIDWSGSWQRCEFYDVFEKYTGLNPDAEEAELSRYAEKNNIDPAQIVGKGRLLDQIYKKLVRPNLIQPQFLVRPPVEMEPLAKRDSEFPNRVQRMQILAAGTELGKGFSELNDPQDQRRRFEEQMQLREQGDKEAQMLDEDYIEALEYGMPPAAGFGISERLFAVLMDKPIREVVLFPPMKRKE